MGGVLTAYLVTTGVIVYRWATGPKEAPPPMAFLGAGVVYSAAGLLAQADKRLGTAVAWAFTLGAFVAPRAQLSPTTGTLAGVPPTQPPTRPGGSKAGLQAAPGVTLSAPGPL